MSSHEHCLGILAGGGSLPLEIASNVRSTGRDVHIVALEGEADADFTGISTEYVNWGAIGRIVSSFKERGVEDLVIVGGVTRPNLKKIKPDFGFFRSIWRIIKIIRAGGDDSVLRKVIGFFEQHGFHVVGVGDVAPELVINSGPFGEHRASSDDFADVAIGFDIIRRLGRFDVGQAIVVNRGVVEAIEGAEGTDRMLQRVAHLRVTKFSKSQRGVLVKRPKPDQERRIDLPAIGPTTAMLASRAGLGGIAVLAGQAIAARRSSLLSTANESELFIEGCSEELDQQAERAKFDGEISFVQLGAIKMSRRDDYDLRKAVGVLEALAPYEIGGAVAVARKHVLAIEVGEGLEAFLARVKSVRQWRDKNSNEKVGMAIFGRAHPYGTKLVSAVHDAGLDGLIVASDAFSREDWSTAIYSANRLKLFIGALTVASRDTR